MKEQLDQLENSVLQVLSAYSDAKKEIETLKAELAQKNEEIAQLPLRCRTLPTSSIPVPHVFMLPTRR